MGTGAAGAGASPTARPRCHRGRQRGDRCLYVSTGGSTREARYEADRSGVPLTLLGMPDLRALLVEHYDALDVETRQLVPLTQVYWPITEG